MEKTQKENQKRIDVMQNYEKLSLLNIYSSGVLSDARRQVVKEMLQNGAGEGEIKSVVSLELPEQEVREREKTWMIMHGK